MSKFEIVNSIVEMARDNESMIKSILGKAIVEECQKEIERPEIFDKIDEITEALVYNLEKIRFCKEGISTQNLFIDVLNERGRDATEEQERVAEWTRQLEKFEKNILTIIEKF